MTTGRADSGPGRASARGARVRTAAAAFALLLALALAVAIGASFLGASDDLALSLPRSADARLVEQRIAAAPGRTVEHVTLLDPVLGSIGFTLSLPDPLPARKLPLVVVLGGLGTGEHNLSAIESPGPNAVAAYDWPLPTALPRGPSLIFDLPELRRLALAVPGQASAMLRWLAAKNWCDPQRITLIGFSLGAVAAPAVDHVARLDGADIGWVVLAYGGVGLKALVEGDERIRPAWIRPLLGAGLALALRPVEPAVYLPRLSGHFLILDAALDAIIAPGARARLEELTPSPKTIIHMAGGHVGTGAEKEKQALLAEAMALTRLWLETDGAVED
jgi:hypothetical protein